MAKFIVEGGHRLKGEIRPQGAKNEALQIICAALLTKERVVLHNVPIIADVMQLLELMSRMGVKVERLSDDDFALQADEINLDYLRSSDYHKRCRKLRGSVMMIGPLLTRFGVGFMPKPGGDKIGRRRLDTHFLGFQKHICTLKALCLNGVELIANIEVKVCTELLEAEEVRIETSTANLIATRLRHEAHAETGQEWTNHHHRATQLTTTLVVVRRAQVVEVYLVGLQRKIVVRQTLNLHAHARHKLQELHHIGNDGYVV